MNYYNSRTASSTERFPIPRDETCGVAQDGGHAGMAPPSSSFTIDSIHNSITILHCNIRSLRNQVNFDQLQHRVNTIKPTLLALNETWLDESHPDVQIHGYTLVSRRDRSTNANRGGVALYARTELNCTVKLENSKDAELTWAVVHSNIGPFLCGIWYRQKNDRESIASFEREWLVHSRDTIGTVILGDLNIHHKKWLHHSSENSTDGEILQTFCQSFGFSQMVNGPTRSFIDSTGALKEYKLD